MTYQIIYWLVIVAFISLIACLTLAPSRAVSYNAPQTQQDAQGGVLIDEPSLRAFARKMALKYEVSPSEISVTIEGESGWQNIQSQVINKKGEQEDSHGVCQIHAPAHPEITREQMYDPYWCIEWMAKEFSEGRASKWSVWKNKFQNPKF